MANVLLVSQIRLGDLSVAMNQIYRKIITQSGHNISEADIFDFDPDQPNLEAQVERLNPDVLFLATATTVPIDQRIAMYSHLLGYRRPILVADLMMVPPLAPKLNVEPKDVYIGTSQARDRLHEEIPRALDQLLAITRYF